MRNTMIALLVAAFGLALFCLMKGSAPGEYSVATLTAFLALGMITTLAGVVWAVLAAVERSDNNLARWVDQQF